MTDGRDGNTTGGRDVTGGHLYGRDQPAGVLRAGIRSGDVPVAVYGLGKMGLPVAAALADVTGTVVGADVDPEVVESINAGDCHVEGEPGLPELVEDAVDAGALRAVEEPREAADAASVHVVVVPTLLTDENEPDLSMLEAVATDIATGIDRGDLVCIESTVPPGTCRDLVQPLLVEESGLNPGSFGVAFCPERTSSGRALEDIRRAYPKVVGGVDAESTRAAQLLYGEVTENDVIPVTDATTAEATKVFGGVYRDVNIALANEFARYAEAMGIDGREAIEASNSQPHSKILDPGPGVGGHCIPVYPYFLLDPFDVDGAMVRTARIVNDSMPGYAVERTTEALEERGTELSDASVLILGVTYRPGVAETRNSPSIPIAERLAGRGATVYAADPLVDPGEHLPATALSIDEATAISPDAVVLVTPHEAFRDLDWAAFGETVVLDTHDALEAGELPQRIVTIGRADDAAGDAADVPVVEEVADATAEAPSDDVRPTR